MPDRGCRCPATRRPSSSGAANLTQGATWSLQRRDLDYRKPPNLDYAHFSPNCLSVSTTGKNLRSEETARWGPRPMTTAASTIWTWRGSST